MLLFNVYRSQADNIERFVCDISLPLPLLASIIIVFYTSLRHLLERDQHSRVFRNLLAGLTSLIAKENSSDLTHSDMQASTSRGVIKMHATNVQASPRSLSRSVCTLAKKHIYGNWGLNRTKQNRSAVTFSIKPKTILPTYLPFRRLM